MYDYDLIFDITTISWSLSRPCRTWQIWNKPWREM